MQGSTIEVDVQEDRTRFQEPWNRHVSVFERTGSVARMEYLPGIGWVSRDFLPQREKRSPR